VEIQRQSTIRSQPPPLPDVECLMLTSFLAFIMFHVWSPSCRQNSV